MPWDQRGLRKYYYQAARVDGKPRRIYWGVGEVGRLHELLTARDRRLRAKRAAERRARMATVAALRRDTRAAVSWVRELVRAARLIGGEYQHRGQWRKRAANRRPVGHDFPCVLASGTTPAPSTPRWPTPNPFVPNIAMTQPLAPATLTPDDLGGRLLALNDRANRGDRSALAELEEVIDRHSVVWQTAARLSADTAAGWARLLGDGGPVTEACLRREVANWKAGLVGANPTPLVTAAVDAAGVAWLAQRYAERELFGAGEKKRAAAVRRLASANRQLQDAFKLVIAARATADALPVRADVARGVAGGPRLFESTA